MRNTQRQDSDADNTHLSTFNAAVRQAIKNSEESSVNGQPADSADRPTCYLGGNEDDVDHTWPVDNCCRIYEYKLYRGRFIDFCHWETQNISHTRNITPLAYGHDNWDKELSSFKCGAKTGIKLYDTPDVDDNTVPTDSAGMYSANPNLTNNNTTRALELTWYGGPPPVTCKPPKICDVEPNLTIYDKVKCGGRSEILVMDKDALGNSLGTSDDTYTAPATWNDLVVKSVLMPRPNEDLEVFKTTGFRSDSFTLKYFPVAGVAMADQKPQCFTFGELDYNEKINAMQYRTMVFPN